MASLLEGDYGAGEERRARIPVPYSTIEKTTMETTIAAAALEGVLSNRLFRPIAICLLPFAF
jgi:hypothetical protein